MLKKISFLFGFLALAGCQSTVVTQGGAEGSSTEISEVTLGNDGTFRVGVLLPLSGNAAKQGNGLKNATMLALEDEMSLTLSCNITIPKERPRELGLPPLMR